MPSVKPSIAIEVIGVTKHYGGKVGISAIDADFHNDGLHLLVGANGSGKSTLIKCIMGLVRFEGEIKKKHFKIGYAPEDYVMPYYMTVRDFLYSIGKLRAPSSEDLDQDLDYFLHYYDLVTHAKVPIGKLSNGMRQKVNLIQAFLHHPKILLLDEPLHALDEEAQGKTIGLIKERMAESLVIVSTHTPEKYKVRSRHVWVLTAGRLGSEPRV